MLSWCSPPLTAGSIISSVSIYEGHPHFWDHLQLALEQPRPITTPLCHCESPIQLKFTTAPAASNHRTGAQVPKDQTSHASRVDSSVAAYQTPCASVFPLLEQLPATINVSCNRLCERTGPAGGAFPVHPAARATTSPCFTAMLICWAVGLPPSRWMIETSNFFATFWHGSARVSVE